MVHSHTHPSSPWRSFAGPVLIGPASRTERASWWRADVAAISTSVPAYGFIGANSSCSSPAHGSGACGADDVAVTMGVTLRTAYGSTFVGRGVNEPGVVNTGAAGA